jgi:DedD protein
MDQMLKQRLIGAIVIISLAVIFIPMILEGPDDALSPRTQDMPPPPTIDYQTEVELPVPAETTEASEAAAPVVTEQEVAAIPEPPTAQPEPTVKPPEVVTKHPEAAIKPPAAVASAKTLKPAVSKQPPPQASAKSAAEPPSAAGAWIVQVGSFGQQPNAVSLRDRLKKSGYPAFVQEVKGVDGHTYRVAIGPETDRGEAEKLRDKLARELRLKGMVLQNK